MKRFNSNRVRPLGNLQPVDERQKRYLRRLNGIQKPHAKAEGPVEVVKPNNDREFKCPMRADWRPAKPRGRSGTRLDENIRRQMEWRAAARAAFFASI